MEGDNIAHVIVRENESLESALRRFKKKVDDEGIIKEFKDRQYFVKPSLAEHRHVREVLHKNARKRALAEKKKSSGRKGRRKRR